MNTVQKRKITHKECESQLQPIQDALEVINGKWKLLIIMSIGEGNSRFLEIQRSIPKLSGKVLAKELKDLEAHDLVQRIVHDEYPVRIEYKVTEYSMSLEHVFIALRDWGLGHRERIKAKLRAPS